MSKMSKFQFEMSEMSPKNPKMSNTPSASPLRPPPLHGNSVVNVLSLLGKIDFTVSLEAKYFFGKSVAPLMKKLFLHLKEAVLA